ncbi:MAG: TM2 domain-containing protein [Clostridia bacterium]|nr:TM2 domain-containing protein [Clostridia bacterium]
MKSKWTAFFLCLFFGALGIHKFYEGKVLLGLLYLCTGGIGGIGIVFDLIGLFFKPDPYYV